MKNIFFLLITFIPITFFAQVGINTSNPDLSATLDVVSTNKGVNFPHVHLLSYTDTTTVPNPKESLIVYNTNTSLKGNVGHYYWDGSNWIYLFNDINKSTLLNSSRYYSAISNTGYNFTKSANQFYTTPDLSIGSTINNEWTVITGLNQNIIVDREKNEILFSISGMAQANNNTSGNNIFSSFGFFIDDKLVSVKPISIDLIQTCTRREFTVYAVVSNIALGNHTVKFAIRNRATNSAQTNLSITFGARNSDSTCNNMLTNDEAIMSGTVYVNLPYVF